MARTHLLIAFLILEVYIEAAPNESNKEQMEPIVVEPITEIPQEGVETSSENLQSQRQKRWYSYSGYGPYYPPFPPRDPPPPSTFYGYDDALTEIHRRLKSIISYVQEPIPQPPPLAPPLFPIFFPSFFLPQSGCNCFPGNSQQQDNKPSPSPVESTTKRPMTNTNTNGTIPDLKERGKDITSSDNLTPLSDDTTLDENLNIDSSRPISFEPIPPNRPHRPPPPVEHGSSQAGVDTPPTQVNPVTPVEDLAPITPPSRDYIPDSEMNPCDGAILSCCHQSFVTFNCFTSQGCTDPASFGDPCDTEIIAQVVEKFRRHYSRRTG